MMITQKAGNKFDLQINASLICRFSFILSLALFIPLTAFTDTQHDNSRQYYDAGSIIIAGDGQDFIIGPGESIKLSAGQSILLLPGTRIEAGGQVVAEVDIKVKPEPAEERPSILRNPEMLALPYEPKPACNLAAATEPEKILRNAGLTSAVLPVQTNNTGKQLPLKKFYTDQFSGLASLSGITNQVYLPVLSWGERPETIRVMRT